MNSIRIRKVDENLKDIIRATIKNGNTLNFGIVDCGIYIKIVLPVATYYVYKEDYLRMMTDILDVKVKVKH